MSMTAGIERQADRKNSKTLCLASSTVAEFAGTFRLLAVNAIIQTLRFSLSLSLALALSLSSDKMRLGTDGQNDAVDWVGILFCFMVFFLYSDYST